MGRAALAERRRRSCGELLLHAFTETRADLLNALTALLGSSEDAQDAVQDAFLKCWRKREQVGGVYNLRAWIFRVGLNSGRDLRRNVWRRRSRPLLDLEPPLERPATSPGDHLVCQETLERFRAALQDLRPDEREVFLLRQNTDRTYEEIARMRGTPSGTVKTRMRTALHKLRQALDAADA